MGEIVHSSVSVNPLTDFTSVSSTYSHFIAETEVLDLDYTQYKQKDSKIGYTKEIRLTSQLSKQIGDSMRLISLNPITADNPSNIDTTHTVDTEYKLDFMSLVEIKSDRNPLGVYYDPKNSKERETSDRLLKAMNLSLKDITESTLGTNSIPPLGTTAWGKYALTYHKSSALKQEYGSEGVYRTKLVEANRDKQKQLKDITDVTVGYFGTFNSKNTISPKATYHTFLSALKRTSIKTTTNQTGKTARKFILKNKLYEAKYTVNGIIEREMEGKINSKMGLGKIEVILEDDNPLNTTIGKVIFSDYGNGNVPYYNRDEWANEGLPNYQEMPKHYVSIKYQTGINTYKELILVDLYQETSIEGNGKKRVGNSGYLDESQGEMTWLEGFIAESFIPLTASSMLKVSTFSRARLLAETKCHFIQAINIQETKWYQSGIIGAIVTVVGVVLNVFTMGLTVTINMLVQSLLVGILTGIALDLVIKVLVDLDIISNGLLIALIAVTSLYFGSGILNLKLDFSLAYTASRLTEATGKAYALELKKETKEYKEKLAELKKETKYYIDKTEEIVVSNTSSIIFELNRMLDSINIPLVETRDEFMDRTLNRRPEPSSLRGLLYLDKGRTYE